MDQAVFVAGLCLQQGLFSKHKKQEVPPREVYNGPLFGFQLLSGI